MFRILFICDYDAVLSPLAAALARDLFNKRIKIQHAGISLKPIPSLIKDYLVDQLNAGDLLQQCKVRQLKEERFNLVIALTEASFQQCDLKVPLGGLILWDYSKWLKVGEELNSELLTDICLTLRERLSDLKEVGFARVLKEVQFFAENILDNLQEGIIVHDLKRKILYVNRSLEKITGYFKEELIGRDCHQIFEGGFCGDKCLFNRESIPSKFPISYPLKLQDREKQIHYLLFTVNPMITRKGDLLGVIASVDDRTTERELRMQLEKGKHFDGIVGNHPSIRRIINLIEDLSDSTVPVLIQGETGTGKELIARAIHAHSPHRNGLFVPVNCGAIPEGTIESELFGHVKGAFTGAIRDKKGRFELADGGTLFLDEVGELPFDMQVKLLRVLQDGTFERVGGEETIKVNVRIISATNRDLGEMVEKGLFREDLYYRLNVLPIKIPPLRERKSDIPLLIQYFFQKLPGLENYRITSSALSVLTNYSWPGNVRQLQSTLRYAQITSTEQIIDIENLPEEIRSVETVRLKVRSGRPRLLNAQIVSETLKSCGGNKSKAAQILGISRATLYRYLKQSKS